MRNTNVFRNREQISRPEPYRKPCEDAEAGRQAWPNVLTAVRAPGTAAQGPGPPRRGRCASTHRPEGAGRSPTPRARRSRTRETAAAPLLRDLGPRSPRTPEGRTHHDAGSATPSPPRPPAPGQPSQKRQPPGARACRKAPRSPPARTPRPDTGGAGNCRKRGAPTGREGRPSCEPTENSTSDWWTGGRGVVSLLRSKVGLLCGVRLLWGREYRGIPPGKAIGMEESEESTSEWPYPEHFPLPTSQDPHLPFISFVIFKGNDLFRYAITVPP